LHAGSRYQSRGGLVRLTLTQSYGGVTSIDSFVRAVLDSSGRLVSLIGAPDPDIEVAGADPAVTRSRAASIAAQSVGAPSRASSARIQQAIFHIGQTARLGWRALVAAGPDERYDVLVDGTSGAVVRRSNLVLAANAASVFPAWPDAPLGGTPVAVDLAPWLEAPAARRA